METPEPPPKLGLALSGGGFRASFFHVGVLARLAELGVLRHVEVISTVSGGSIVGALYYIRLRTLLQSKPDAEMTDDDYVELVEGLEREFLAGVKRNIRARVLLNPFKNFWMALSPNYSRSDRIGDLYDLLLYKPAWPEPRPKRTKRPQFVFGQIDKQIELRELYIVPPGEPADFSPTTGNAKRKAKVPALVINATSLNTGHSWCFEVVRMGEPVPYLGQGADDIDVNLRLDQGDLLPVDGANRILSQDDFPLGLAVAASAGVPALFHPLAISDLYGDDLRVELVDGGVHDNQGVQALLEKLCNRFVISDASGQLSDQVRPQTRVPGVASRSMGIYGDSLRDEQLLHMLDRNQPVALMHLRKGLPRPVLTPKLKGSSGPAASPEAAADAATRVKTADFGVDEEVQRRLAATRTDLDAFSDIEAHSLMLDGYLMTENTMKRQTRLHEFVRADPVPKDVDPVPKSWSFEPASPLIGVAPDWYRKRLAIGRERFMKPARLLSKWIWIAVVGLVLLALVLLAWAWYDDIEEWMNGSWPVKGVLGVLGVIFLFLVAYLVEKPRIPIPVVGPAISWVLKFLGSVVLPFLAALPALVFASLTYLVGRLHVRLGKLPR